MSGKQNGKSNGRNQNTTKNYFDPLDESKDDSAADLEHGDSLLGSQTNSNGYSTDDPHATDSRNAIYKPGSSFIDPSFAPTTTLSTITQNVTAGAAAVRSNISALFNNSSNATPADNTYDTLPDEEEKQIQPIHNAKYQIALDTLTANFDSKDEADAIREIRSTCNELVAADLAINGKKTKAILDVCAITQAIEDGKFAIAESAINALGIDNDAKIILTAMVYRKKEEKTKEDAYLKTQYDRLTAILAEEYKEETDKEIAMKEFRFILNSKARNADEHDAEILLSIQSIVQSFKKGKYDDTKKAAAKLPLLAKNADDVVFSLNSKINDDAAQNELVTTIKNGLIGHGGERIIKGEYLLEEKSTVADLKQAVDTALDAVLSEKNQQKLTQNIAKHHEEVRKQNLEKGENKAVDEDDIKMTLAAALAPKSVFDRLNKDDKKTLTTAFTEFSPDNQWTELLFRYHGYLGMAGEGFYLNWTELALIAMLAPILPGISSLVIATAAIGFIGIANVTFSPASMARDHIQNLMKDYENSVSIVMYASLVLSLMFGFMAFGGGYIEVEGLYDILTSLSSKILVSIILSYAAMSYYYMYNYADTLAGFNKWMSLDWNSVKAIKEFSNGNINEGLILSYSVGNEIATNIERIFRMAYGGFYAGTSVSGKVLAYILAIFVAIGTGPVSFATRGLKSRKFFDAELSGLTPEQYNHALAEFEATEATSGNGFKNALAQEALLFISCNLFLQGPLVALSMDHDHLASARNIILGTAILALSHVALRNTAKRKLVIDKALIAANKFDLKDADGESAQLSFLGYVLSVISCVLDLFSRNISFCYVLQAMIPSVFNLDTPEGKFYQALALSLDAFISLPGYAYQLHNVQDALMKIFPVLVQLQSQDRTVKQFMEEILKSLKATVLETAQGAKADGKFVGSRISAGALRLKGKFSRSNQITVVQENDVENQGLISGQPNSNSAPPPSNNHSGNPHGTFASSMKNCLSKVSSKLCPGNANPPPAAYSSI